MMLNQTIKSFKSGNSLAFNNIIKYMDNDINYIIRNFNIPGKNIDDLKSLAIEQIFDCLTERKLKRGKGVKKILNENDDELKNKNFIKAAIKNKMIRELRATKASIRISYDIPILDNNNKNYLDRKGKPLFIGLIFKENEAFLYEGCKNIKVKINASQNDICRNNSTFEMKDVLDSSISFDLQVNDKENEHEMKDVFEYSTCKKDYDNEEKKIEIHSLIEYVNKLSNINESIKNTIKNLLLCSNNLYALKDYIKNNRKQVMSCKQILFQLLN